MRLSKEELELILKWYSSYVRDTGGSIDSLDLKMKIDSDLRKNN